ncbi:YaaA family protein [Klebsiella variicola subsp. variicola]|nr:YaaA family protein [Klebsiella variicola subsp. variicola]
MSRYIIENRLTQPEQLKAFNSEGYFSLMRRLRRKANWCLNATSSRPRCPRPLSGGKDDRSSW